MDAKKLSSGLRQRIVNNKDFKDKGISVVTKVVEGKTVVYLKKKAKK